MIRSGINRMTTTFDKIGKTHIKRKKLNTRNYRNLVFSRRMGIKAIILSILPILQDFFTID